nr:acyltransferase family protein [uncultured Candidatus Microthrix sp.]
MADLKQHLPSTAPSDKAQMSAVTAENKPTERSAWHDNVRFVAICLVVAGHWGIGRRWMPEFDAISNQMVYSFHMALFVILAGRFSKPGGSLSTVFRQGWGQLLVPLGLFITFDSLLMHRLTGAPSVISTRAFPYGLWFLASLFCWRLLVLPLGRWRTVDVLAGPLAVVLLAASGLVPNVFSLIRTLAFFPAFLFGMAVLPRIEPTLRRPMVRCFAAMWVVAGLLLVAYQSDRNLKPWMLQASRYADMGSDQFRGAAIRIGLMVFGMVMAVGIMALVSARNLGVVSRLGRYTLYAYLLHLPVTRVLRFWLFPNTKDQPLVAVAVTLAIIPFTMVAMSAPVRRLTQPMVEPIEFVRPRPSPSRTR